MPAATHAMEIFGASNSELLSLQRLAAATMTPSALGRPLTALRLIKGDPAEKAAIAPLLRWSREVWDSANSMPKAFSLAQLSRLWRQGSPGFNVSTETWK